MLHVILRLALEHLQLGPAISLLLRDFVNAIVPAK
jgi:hypothetical protein